MKTLYTLISLVILSIVLPQNAFSIDNDVIEAGHTVPVDNNCDKLPSKLLACEEYRCVRENNDGDVTGVFVKAYDQKLKTCTHQQSTATDAVITCKYDDETRKFVANMMQKQSQGHAMSEQEQDLMDVIYKTNCTEGEFNFKFSDENTTN